MLHPERNAIGARFRYDRGGPRHERRGVAAGEGSAISTVCRKRGEEVFAWTKVIEGLARLKPRGLDTVRAVIASGLAACHLVRPPETLKPKGEFCPAGGK
jgi:hypothetical protein